MKILATLTAASLLGLAGVAAVAQTSPPTAAPAPTAPPAAAPAAPPAAAPAAPAAQAPADAQPRRQFSAADLRAIVDARLAGVPTGLKLTAEQQRLWPALETALREEAAERIARIEERRNARAAPQATPERDLAQRLEERSRRVGEMAQRLQSLSSAMTPFWASLNEDQKRLLPELIRPRAIGGREQGGRGRGEWRERRRAMMDHHRDHHGGRGMGQGGGHGQDGHR